MPKSNKNDVRGLVAQADKLLGNQSFDARERLASRRRAQTLLEQALESAPEDVEALYYLAWSWATDADPPADPAPRIEPLRLRLVALTKDAKPSKEPTLEARAHSFALAWGLPERAATSRTLAEAEAHLEEAKLATKLRANQLTKRALRGAEAALVFARARDDGDVASAHQWLWSWIEKNPVHAYFLEDGSKSVSAAAGLEPFFEDDDFVAFVRAREARTVLDEKVAQKAMAFALGFDKIEYGYQDYEPPRFGRLARVLALHKLGAPVATKIKGDSDTPWTSVELAAVASPMLLPHLVEMGLSLDHGLKAPPLVALTEAGETNAVAALVRAGANKDAKDKKGRTALDVAMAVKRADLMKALGATRTPGGVDTTPARDFIASRGAELLASAWAKRAELASLDAVSEFLSAVELHGPKTWEGAAELLATLGNKDRLALAHVLRSICPAGPPVTMKRADGSTPRIVLGDLHVDGELVLSSHWLVTGSVQCDRYGDDETGSLTTPSDLVTRFLHTEGDLWVGGDVTASAMAWAEYEAGTFFVSGKLTTKLFVEGQHVVDIGEVAADKKLELESTDKAVASAHFPKEAFADGELSAGKLWKLVRAGTFPA